MKIISNEEVIKDLFVWEHSLTVTKDCTIETLEWHSYTIEFKRQWTKEIQN